MKKWISILLCILTFASLLYIFSNAIKSASQVEKTKSRVVETVEFVVEKVAKKEISLKQFSKTVLPKIGHVLEYSVFAALFSFTRFFIKEKKERDDFVRIMFACVFVALTDEHLQSLGAGRTSKVSDVMIDLAACMFGYALSALLFLLLERRKTRGNRSAGA